VREAAAALGVSEGLVRKWLPELPHALARMLKPFGIHPERGRVGTANPVSVYTRASFEPVWERYFPYPPRRETDTTQTVRLSGESPTRRLSMSKGPPPINFSTRLALRPAECAVALGVCERTLRRWMRDERLPFFRVERGVFIPSAELERWMHDRIESEQATTKLADEILNDF